MITGINLNETQDYISKYDSGEPKTVWQLGTVDSEAMPIVMSDQEAVLETMTMMVRFGLKGFKNFTNAQGKEVQYKTEPKVFRGKQYHVVADSIIKIMPMQILLELGTELMKLGKLSEEEIKN